MLLKRWEPRRTDRYAADEAALRAELAALQAELSAERGQYVLLALDGDTWGGAQVLVDYPRTQAGVCEMIEFDDGEYPALAEFCAVRAPGCNDD